MLIEIHLKCNDLRTAVHEKNGQNVINPVNFIATCTVKQFRREENAVQKGPLP